MYRHLLFIVALLTISLSDLGQGSRITNYEIRKSVAYKGKPLVTSDRLIFQVQFAGSLFGQNYPLIHVPPNMEKNLADRLVSNKRCFANFSTKSFANSTQPLT